MTTKPIHDHEGPEAEPADVIDDHDVEGHSLAQTDFHRQIATSRVRESADATRSGHPRKADKAQSKGRNGR